MGKQLWLSSIALAVIGYALSFQKSTIGTFGRIICIIGTLGIIVGLFIYAHRDAFLLLITQPKKFVWKLTQTIGLFLFVMVLAFVVLYLTDGKWKNTIAAIAAYSALVPMLAIWKIKKAVSIKCPQCGKKLYRSTEEMIGEVGVCKKCKAEFTIRQEDTEPKDQQKQ